MQDTAKAIVISSVSGGGKTTAIQLLRKKCPKLHLAVTATTREPRGKEKNGKDYYFYSHKEFQKKIEQNAFLEHALVHGNRYGIPMETVGERLAQGICVILNIDIQGMKTVKKKMGKNQIISFFLMPPSEEIWMQRLQKRNTNTEAEIMERVKQGRLEIEQAEKYDHIIINDTLEEALQKIISILKKNKLALV